MADSSDNSTAKEPVTKRPGLLPRLLCRFFSWTTLRRALLSLAVLITLIAVVHLIEGIRGRRVWAKFQAEMTAAGESLNPEDFRPAPVPDELNFARTPLLAPLLDYEYTDKPEAVWRDPEAKKRIDGLYGIGDPEIATLTDRHHRRLTDLTVWQAYYRTNNQFALPDEGLSKPVILPGSTNSPAGATMKFDPDFAPREVLLALAKYDPEMNELHAAAQRPHAQFPIHYDEGFATLLPHLQALRKFARIAHLKGVAHLVEKRPDDAFAELQLMIRMSESFRNEPFLISGLVHIALGSHITGLIWEGIARRQWTPEQLQRIETGLRSIDNVAMYHRAIRGERALCISTLLRNRHNLEQLGTSDVSAGFFRWAPSGLFYQNLVHMGRMYQDQALLPLDQEAKRIDLRIAAEVGTQIKETFGSFHPYRIYAAAVFPAVNKALLRYAEGQTDIDMARLACGIEQFRAKNGRLPEALAVLVPNFLPKLPHDPVSGDNYIYRPDGDDYLIYSVGPDSEDNGGKVEWNDNGKARLRDRGDWVWHSSPANAQ